MNDKLIELALSHYADNCCTEIIKKLRKFQDSLDDNHEMYVYIEPFGKLLITAVGYQNPDIIYFQGFIGENYTEVMQHISQLNMVLTSVPKTNETAPPKRFTIGFASDIK